MSFMKRSFQQLKEYPSAIAGAILILLLVFMAIYAMVSVPYGEAINLWRGSDNIWLESPRNALPKWVNLFRSQKLPETIALRTTEMPETKSIEGEDGFYFARIEQTFDFQYDDFPSEINLFLESKFEHVGPHVEITWETPDGRVISLTEMSARRTETYRISQDDRLRRRLDGRPAHIGLFADPAVQGDPVPLKGEYKLVIDGFLFEDGADIDASLVVYGQVHGLAGTDHQRRDITVALLWGTPVALAFGLVAAVGTSILTLVLAATGVWFGGWVDNAIRRITEVNMILPMLPILIMVGTFYSRSIWIILGAVVLLSIFGGGIMTYRAMFLQVKESGYIEAARAYGASSARIIFRYMVPRVIPVLIPQFVVQIPAFVFLEASLAVLGLGDPVVPTWGKLLNDAYTNGALYMGQYYWVLQPAALLMVAGLGFSMLGFALDRVFNPRLRGL